MTPRLTLFTATLVQDSALSVSGVDRDRAADQPFALVDGVPTLAGRGLKGAAVAMARRFFEPLPRSVSDNDGKGFRRSAWEFAHAVLPQDPQDPATMLQLRAGVGIRHKTGARAGGVLYDRETIPAGTRWPLMFRVDWSLAGDEAAEAEGVLGHVLAEHWAAGRCWLGGGVARGLGWCHIDDLRAYRLDADAYDRWVESGRNVLPEPLSAIPVMAPTRSWCFRTLDLTLSFGEYQPDADGAAWGLDMLAVGPHDTERAVQATGDGAWARPSWAAADDAAVDGFSTDRALLMDGDRPLLPGSSVRGPLRHAFSRAKTAAGERVEDPHPVQGGVPSDDPAGQVFGTVARSSRVLIRDGRAEGGWAAARLHMHAEDEFSAGSYGSAKRDAVRLLRGVFPVRIVVEGPDADTVEPLMADIDRLVALGALGHLPVGGHKTRGAGWGRWQPEAWATIDVTGTRRWTPADEGSPRPTARSQVPAARTAGTEAAGWTGCRGSAEEAAHVRVTPGTLESPSPTLGEVAALARADLGEDTLVAWWCDPSIDLGRAEPPATFGWQWPDDRTLGVDEVAFFAERAVWRAARTAAGAKWVFIKEVPPDDRDAQPATVVHTPARLHGFARFAAAQTGQGMVVLREWHIDDAILGFTLLPRRNADVLG